MFGKVFTSMTSRVLVVAIVWAASVSTSVALDEGYLGTWSRNGGVCGTDSWMHIGENGLAGHEFACSTKRSKWDGKSWRVTFACSAEGSDYTLQVRWRLLKDGRLRETIDGTVRDYKRCSAAEDKPAPKNFAEQCVSCFNEAQEMIRSVGGYCPPECADTFGNMECDSKGVCGLPD